MKTAKTSTARTVTHVAFSSKLSGGTKLISRLFSFALAINMSACSPLSGSCKNSRGFYER